MPLRKVWKKVPPKPIKLDQKDKTALLKEVNNFIVSSQKLSNGINRIKIRAGRIYFYFLYKPMRWNDPNAIFIKPLIDGKYFEDIFARITLFDKKGIDCTADWQRHTGEWIVLNKGTLRECLQFIEIDDRFFF